MPVNTQARCQDPRRKSGHFSTGERQGAWQLRHPSTIRGPVRSVFSVRVRDCKTCERFTSKFQQRPAWRQLREAYTRDSQRFRTTLRTFAPRSRL